MNVLIEETIKHTAGEPAEKAASDLLESGTNLCATLFRFEHPRNWQIARGKVLEILRIKPELQPMEKLLTVLAAAALVVVEKGKQADEETINKETIQ